MPIFQAMVDGKTIQVKNGNGWIDIDGNEDGLNLDSLIDYQDCYRIKPKPRYRPMQIRLAECLNIGFWLKKTGSYLTNAPLI